MTFKDITPPEFILIAPRGIVVLSKDGYIDTLPLLHIALIRTLASKNEQQQLLGLFVVT